MTRELRILCGIAGIGKSTWAINEARCLEEEGWSTAVISRDTIRFSLLDERGSDDYFAYENEVFNIFVKEINDCLALGIDYIFVDATHISYPSRMKVLDKLKMDEKTTVVFEVFEAPLEVILYRNSQRRGRACVPVGAIKSMKRTFKAPTQEETQRIKTKLNLKNNFVIRIHKER